MIFKWKIDTITGNTSATSTRPLVGELKAVYVKYAVTPNAATDVTIATANEPTNTLLTLTNNATSGWYYPRAVVQDEAGVDVTYDGTNEVYGCVPIADYVTVTVAQGDADQTLDVWLYIEE